MRNSLKRVRCVLEGKLPDRPPLYDLIRNDAVLSHFAGETLTVENAPRLVYRVYHEIVDATRPKVRLPDNEETVVLADGRKERRFRWTTWVEPRVYRDAAHYAEEKRKMLESADLSWSETKEQEMRDYVAHVRAERERLGELYFFPGAPSLGLMGIYGEVGFEQFAYYFAEYPDLIHELLEFHATKAVAWIEHIPADAEIEAVFIGDDIAFRSGPLLSPSWFAEQYFPRFERVVSAYHRKGIRVLFHSDGNLNPILDGLVETGIDGLNPIEIVAGMDVGEIHRRYPRLFMAGGIDVSQLLPYGTPDVVRDATLRSIEAAEGRLMVGSSTELNDDVPLENFLAMYETVLNYRY